MATDAIDAPGADDTSVSETDTSLDGAATSESGTEFSEGTNTAAAERLKLKWLGREEEIDDPRKLAERFSDEYEYEFNGPGGKPMKAKWPEIERHVQMSAGAQERMKQANAMRQQQQALIAWAKEEDFKNLPAALEVMFGVDDAYEIAERLAHQRYQRASKQEQIAAHLAVEQDPTRRSALLSEYNRMLAEEQGLKQSRRKAWEEKWGSLQQQGQQSQADAEREHQEVTGQMKQAGIAVNAHTIARAAYIKRQHEHEFGVKLAPRQVAYELRKQLDQEVLAHIDSLPIDKQLAFLGDQRRAKLREAEVAAVKAAQKQARQNAAPKKQESSSNGSERPKVQDIESFIRHGAR
jgi:hypothetical protein